MEKDKICLDRRVNYYETDKMGVVHHSNYIRWFEEARVMWLLEAGIPYDDIEEMGVQMPVIGVKCEYKMPAKFGDIICVKPETKEITGVKFIIGYTITNKKTNKVLVLGETKHCFVNSEFKVINLRKTNPNLYEKLSEL